MSSLVSSGRRVNISLVLIAKMVKKYICPQCDKAFTTKQSLWRHKQKQRSHTHTHTYTHKHTYTNTHIHIHIHFKMDAYTHMGNYRNKTQFL